MEQQAAEERRQREYKKQKKAEKIAKGRLKKAKKPDEVSELDDEDLEIANQALAGKKKKKRLVKPARDVEEEQIDTVPQSKKVKQPKAEQKLARETSTMAEDVEMQDMFESKDHDNFWTPQDTEIEKKDIPERLQVKLSDRFDPPEEELQDEANWIYTEIIDSLEAAKESIPQNRV